MSVIEFKDKFIGYVDILGWKEKVKEAEAGTGMPLAELLELLKELGAPEDRSKFDKYGPTTCPESNYTLRDLDFQLIQISDCVIVSCEISPAGVINLVHHCWGAVIKLLNKGIMCRGYITQGSVYHNGHEIIGSGYQEAFDKEDKVSAFKRNADERGTPFVEIDPSICNYVKDCGDSCVKEMFSRYVKQDGSLTALFPFQRLQHSFIIGDNFGHKFNPEKERQSNENMRSMIEKMKERVMALVDQSRPDAVSKAEHYIAALDAQIKVCRQTDKMITMLGSPFPQSSGGRKDNMNNENDLSINEHDNVNAKESIRIRKTDEFGCEIGESVDTHDYEISSSKKGAADEVSFVSKNRKKRDKEGEELSAAQELIRAYNKLNHTDYKNPELYPDQHSSIDVTCESNSGKYPKLDIQVTVSDHKGFEKIGKGESFKRQTTSGYDLFSENLKKAIANKFKAKYTQQDRQTIILVLYGWPLAYKSDLEKFKENETSFLQDAGFREVWFVGVDVSGHVIKLFPK